MNDIGGQECAPRLISSTYDERAGEEKHDEDGHPSHPVVPNDPTQ